MTVKVEQFTAKNPNPMLCVAKNGTVTYSNEAAEPFLNQWDAEIGDKLPSDIVDIVQRVLSLNILEKIEIKAGKSVYFVVFHPSPEQECVNIYGFDISDQKEVEEKYSRTVEKPIPYQALLKENHALKDENQSLRARLKEPEELQRAIREGDIDGLVMPVSSEELLVFILNSADSAYRMLLETANEDMVIVDAEFKVTYAGKRLINKIGCSQEEVIGKSWLDFVDEESKAYSELRMKMRRQGSDENYELKLNCQDGSPLWILASSKPLFDENGKFKGALSMLTDINERKKSEDEMAKQAKLLNLSYDAIMIRDEMDRIAYWNEGAENIYGYTKEEAIGHLPHELLKTEFPQPLEEIFEILHRDNRWTGELTHTRKDGSKINVATRWVLDRDPLGNPHSILEANSDITKRKRTEAQIQELMTSVQQEKEKLSALIRSIPDEVWFADTEKKFTLANPSALREFGLTYEDINVEELANSLEVYHPDGTQRPVDEAPPLKALKGDIVRCQEEYILTPATQELRYRQINAAPVKDSDGNIIGSVCVVRDITDLKRAEEALHKAYEKLHVQNEELQAQSEEIHEANEALRDSEERFRTMANAIPQLAWIARPDGYIYWYNERWYAYTGTTPKQMEGWGWQSVHDPEMLPKVLEQWKASIANGQPFDMEFPLRGVDGIFRQFLTRGFPLKDAKGQVLQWFGTNTDITERKQMEDALKKARDRLEEKVKERTAELEIAYISLKESEELLADAQKIARVGSFDWNIETNEEYWSDELYRIFGLDPQNELNHNTFLNCIHKEDLEYVSHAINEALNGKPYNIDYRIILPDREERAIYSQGGVIFDEKNKPIRMRGIVQDITERKKVEENLARIEIARKKEIHHRIKNNLQVISSLLDLQAETFRDQEYIKDSEVLRAFRESQNRVISMALIHEELYKGGGFETLNFSPYIEELVDNLLKTYSIGNTDVSLNMDLVENAFFDMDTAVPLGIIVNELVSNSLKYAFAGREKGEIQIKIHTEEIWECKNEDCNTTFVLTISDNGVGIPENIDIEELESLGLQLVTSLVDQLDGELELKRGNGTEFTIRFTVTEKDKHASAKALQLAGND